MDVGLDHMAEARTTLGEQGEHSVDIALRVHNNRLSACEDRVAPIAQLGGLDGRDVGRHPRTIPHAHANGLS